MPGRGAQAVASRSLHQALLPGGFRARGPCAVGLAAARRGIRPESRCLVAGVCSPRRRHPSEQTCPKTRSWCPSTSLVVPEQPWGDGVEEAEPGAPRPAAQGGRAQSVGTLALGQERTSHLSSSSCRVNKSLLGNYFCQEPNISLERGK